MDELCQDLKRIDDTRAGPAEIGIAVGGVDAAVVCRGQSLNLSERFQAVPILQGSCHLLTTARNDQNLRCRSLDIGPCFSDRIPPLAPQAFSSSRDPNQLRCPITTAEYGIA